jgi:dUTP pyrophosphatase
LSEKIKIKYLDKNIDKLKKVEHGDWVDLRVSSVKLSRNKKSFVEISKADPKGKELSFKKGDVLKIGLGVAMELPKGYEANAVPRSSTFKHYGLIQLNHFGIIDESYNGNNDQWIFMGYALKDGKISKNDRVCQFRINKKMPDINFKIVEDLENENRGGIGSTGKQ